MSWISPFTVPVYSSSDDAGSRLLLCVSSATLQGNLIDQAMDIGGYKKGDWFIVPSREAVLSLMEKAREMGGNVFTLGIADSES